MQQLTEAVRARLAGLGETVSEASVQAEVSRLLSPGVPWFADALGREDHDPGRISTGGGAPPPAGTNAGPPDPARLHDRVVISVNGPNRRGVVADITRTVCDLGGDIRDISQTMVGDLFTMILVVEFAPSTQRGSHFAEFKERMESVGRNLGVHVVALHDDILHAMHSV